MGKIIEIHAYMVIQMQQVLNEYRKVADQLRNAISRKSVESAAELLVSMAVEKQFGICSEDIEQATIMNEEQLQYNSDFLACTEQLSQLMHELNGSTQNLVEGATAQHLEGMD
eukprot:CAMPEP_0115107338 /NCGR_PEP_ID=MMETSP0227-20121206/37253_1 /TAXON_ID=89957 /ORGANISM="Polarella glacialis, Strain CCMP 1383" /LENGTH=112 /DNA_ID=CAMNT_0002505231 /DNA_START=198 /DNA_END=536 /DNA_ORIENTATION=-